MSNDNFNIKITVDHDGRKFKLVKSRWDGCRGCAFNTLQSCPKIFSIGRGYVYPCHHLGQNLIWKEKGKSGVSKMETTASEAVE